MFDVVALFSASKCLNIHNRCPSGSESMWEKVATAAFIVGSAQEQAFLRNVLHVTVR